MTNFGQIFFNHFQINFLYSHRYCLFGLNVGLTEKFESNSKPMKIHVSDPCKMLLDERYILEERTEGQELMDKVFKTNMEQKGFTRFSIILMISDIDSNIFL